jgi:hypothetical protein
MIYRLFSVMPSAPPGCPVRTGSALIRSKDPAQRPGAGIGSMICQSAAFFSVERRNELPFYDLSAGRR